MIGAMQDYKRAAIRAMRDVESGFRPEVIAEIRERGGSTSKDFETRQDPGQIERGGDGTALGGTGGDFSQEDLQAIKFARDHPNDPRSEEILRSLGLK
jgi:hypothetical protein